MTDKLERIKAYAESHPADPFAWYGLAMEYRSLGRTDEAIAQFQRLLADHPGYVPTYLMLGQTLEKAGRIDEAREVYEKGVAAARAAGNQHAASELQGALDLL